MAGEATFGKDTSTTKYYIIQHLFLNIHQLNKDYIPSQLVGVRGNLYVCLRQCIFPFQGAKGSYTSSK